jgi:ArsR family transcriptional regulator
MMEKQEKPEKTTARPRKRESAESGDAPGRDAVLDRAAQQFKALGDPTRLRILRLLAGDSPVAPPTDGEETAASVAVEWTVGDVNLGLFGKSKATSTLSHHLKELRNAGLITMKRRGKNLLCRVQPDAVAALRCELVISDEFDVVRKGKSKERGKSSDGTFRSNANDATTA